MKRHHLFLPRALIKLQILLALILLGSGLFYVHGFNQQQNTLAIANSVFSAIAVTQQQLGARLEQIAKSPTLQHSLEQKRQHLIQGELRSSIRLGSLDSLNLTSSDCTFDVRLTSPGHRNPVCQAHNMQTSDLIIDNEIPTLTARRPIPSATSQGYWLTGTLELGPVWFTNLGNIRESFRSEKLHYFNDQEKLYELNFLITHLSESSKLMLASSGLSLATSDFKKYIVLLTHHHMDQTLPELLWFILALQVLFGLSLSYLQKNISKKETSALQKFYSDTKIILPDLERTEKTQDYSEVFENITGALSQRFEVLEQENGKLSAKVQQVSQEIRESQHKLRLMRNKREDSIYGAVDRQIILYFLQRARRNQIGLLEKNSELKKRSAALGTNILEPNSKLLNLWRDDIKFRGARKFIRSLDETEFKDGVSNLEQQLSMIIASQQECCNMLDYIETSTLEAHRAANKQTRLLNCLQQLVSKKTLRCDDLFRHMQIINEFYNEIAVDALSVRLSHNLHDLSKLKHLHSVVFPIIQYFYHLLFTSDEMLKIPSLIHKIEHSGTSLVHAFYFSSSSDWLQMHMQRDHKEETIAAMLEWAEHCGIKIHMIPQSRGSCALIIKESLQAVSPSIQTANQHASMNSTSLLQ